ncbi:hypothetical protein CR513_49890, partial [Mucuna pruriens]
MIDATFDGESEEHLDVFARTLIDMLGIDPDFLCHHLPIASRTWPLRRKPTSYWWLTSLGSCNTPPGSPTNVVMVKKPSGKWRMCTDYTDLNNVCPKDLYPLPNVDRRVNGASDYG